MPSPYEQSPPEDDRARRERVDALLREEPRQREEVYPADGARAEQWHARGDDTGRRHEEGRRQMTEQRRQEQDGILRRQREAEHAAQAARLGQPTGQNQGVTITPTSASASSGPITGYLQMPLESPTRCVTLFGAHLCPLSWYLKNLNTGLVQNILIKRETLILFFPILG